MAIGFRQAHGFYSDLGMIVRAPGEPGPFTVFKHSFEDFDYFEKKGYKGGVSRSSLSVASKVFDEEKGFPIYPGYINCLDCLFKDKFITNFCIGWMKVIYDFNLDDLKRSQIIEDILLVLDAKNKEAKEVINIKINQNICNYDKFDEILQEAKRHSNQIQRDARQGE